MIKDLLTIEIKFSESHLLFPAITRTILIILGCIILIKFLFKKYRTGTFKEFKFQFFEEGYDKLKLFGTIFLLGGYVVMLKKLGFLPATIAFVFLSSLLFIGDLKPKTLLISIANSLVTSYFFWFIFGRLINITLP